MTHIILQPDLPILSPVHVKGLWNIKYFILSI